MINLDQRDRQLLALLQHDSRASVTTLAGALGVSRATLQNRLARLTSSGAIARFTIELGTDIKTDIVRAIMMIEIEGALEKRVLKTLRKIPEITATYATNGKWDLVVVIETASLAAFDAVLRDIRHISGVRNSDTSLLLSTV